MNAIFKKLNFKDQDRIHIINAPSSFTPAMDEMQAFTAIETSVASTEKADFILAFVTQQVQIDELTPLFSKALEGDGLFWFAYPKSTSKNFKCDFNRDTGWNILGKFGFEAVRQVAIDEDWSALRFRRVAYIKTLKRDSKRAMSEEGKMRTGK